jgi:hypothetical protein
MTKEQKVIRAKVSVVRAFETGREIQERRVWLIGFGG